MLFSQVSAFAIPCKSADLISLNSSYAIEYALAHRLYFSPTAFLILSQTQYAPSKDVFVSNKKNEFVSPWEIISDVLVDFFRKFEIYPTFRFALNGFM